MRAAVPPELELDLFEGAAWVAVVPFRMSGVRLKCTPALPWLSAFPELNVRTYVTRDGKPGVWFFSLDAGNPLAVKIARGWYHLAYFNARMALEEDAQGIRYTSLRTHKGAAVGEFRGRYRPTGGVYAAKSGSLEHWLTERYCLYAQDAQRRVYRGEIHHVLWPLQPAEADLEVNTMARAAGLELPNERPLLHFARRLDVVAWALERLGG